jgi:hypothetical protein
VHALFCGNAVPYSSLGGAIPNVPITVCTKAGFGLFIGQKICGLMPTRDEAVAVSDMQFGVKR